MGVNDDREMLEAAKEEVGRLERENAALADHLESMVKLADEDDAEMCRLRTALKLTPGHLSLVSEIEKARGERDAALAVIAEADVASRGPWPYSREVAAKVGRVWQALTKSPTDALAEHDKRVKADALDEAAAWAEGVAERMGVGSYEHGPSGREIDLWQKYEHASEWLAGRAAELRADL